MSAKRTYNKVDMKVVMVGDASIGKTCLVLRYMDRKFQESISTIGAFFTLKSWGNYNVAIWDTAGSERYAGLNTFYYRKAAAAVLCFDLTDRQSFESLSEKYIPVLNSLSTAKLKAIVATKCDLLHKHERQVTVTEASELAKKLNPRLYEDTGFIPYFETSSKTGANVDKMFEFTFEHFYPNGGSEPRPVIVEKSITLSNNNNNNNSVPKENKSPCC